MTSPSPLLYDTYYHIYNRGNNRENIFSNRSRGNIPTQLGWAG